MDTTSHRKVPHDRTIKVKEPAKRDTGDLIKDNLKSMMDLRTKRARDIRGTMKDASEKVMGEGTELTELSKATLKSYAKKAMADGDKKLNKSFAYSKKASKSDNNSDADHNYAVSNHYNHLATKRYVGATKAYNKLGETYQDVKDIYRREVIEFMGQIRQAYEELVEHENEEEPIVYVDWKMIAGYAETLRDALIQSVPKEVEEGYQKEVSESSHSWGKTVTVYPEHRRMIAALKHGDSVKFKDKTGAVINAQRIENHIHLKSDRSNKIVKLGVHHFNESETTAAKLRNMGKSIDSVASYGKAKRDETAASLLMRHQSETDPDRKRALFNKIKRMRSR